jgi:FkbM family methyltransferase
MGCQKYMKHNFHDNIQYLKEGAQIYIYGCGTFGRSFYYSIKTYRPDIQILGFVNSTQSGELYGKPVICINDFNQDELYCDYIIICTDQSYWEEIIDKLDEKQLLKYLVNIYWDFDIFGKKTLDKYNNYDQYIGQIRNIFSSEDDFLTWDRLTSSMRLQNIKNLLAVGNNKQKTVNYKKYIKLQKGGVVINGGASFGKESIFFADQVGDNGVVYAFDPNINSDSGYKCIKNIPMVLWNMSECVNFRVDGSRSMIVNNESGDVKIHSTTIDDFVIENLLKQVDLIKLDVEGVELEVLEGAVNTIKKFRPALAISIYHKFEHFFEIPLLIDRLVDDYTFHIECFNSYAIDTIFFAIPNESQ